MNNRSSETLAVIPARGGSKGIPRKNIVDLCGKPLIGYSIDAARAASSVNRIIVSTDDEEIAAVAENLGAEVPFLRPTGIAGDRADIGDAFTHVLEELKKREGYAPDYVLQLYPTHPFRTPALLDELTDIAGRGYSAVWTVRPVSFDETDFVRLNRDETITPLLSRQDAFLGRTGKTFRKYGSAAVIAAEVVLNKEYHYPITDPAALVDIDEPVDLLQAECIINNNLFDFGLQ